MRFLLRLYPPAWQRRYRREVAAHLEAAPLPRIRTSLDLIAGAIDAWLNPKWTPETSNAGDEHTMITASRSGSVAFSRADAERSAGWMIGVTLALTTVAVALDKTVGEHMMIKALLYSAFFIGLTVSTHSTFLRPYSRMARGVILTLAAVAWYAFFLVMSLIAAMT